MSDGAGTDFVRVVGATFDLGRWRGDSSTNNDGCDTDSDDTCEHVCLPACDTDDAAANVAIHAKSIDCVDADEDCDSVLDRLLPQNFT